MTSDARALHGGVAVITGGAGTGAGLGQGLVLGFAAQGMRVAILDVDATRALPDVAERQASTSGSIHRRPTNRPKP